MERDTERQTERGRDRGRKRERREREVKCLSQREAGEGRIWEGRETGDIGPRTGHCTANQSV